MCVFSDSCINYVTSPDDLFPPKTVGGFVKNSKECATVGNMSCPPTFLHSLCWDPLQLIISTSEGVRTIRLIILPKEDSESLLADNRAKLSGLAKLLAKLDGGS